ncbi:hypothetical protein C5E02_13525 [Rathayibacter rathayi]|uniref:DUF306 domain-containing protein n=1 Tax=Rathayibacter rathayi TaxID=33887 RepID=A0ABD6W981_RATRA|nr:hypothetical protein C1O28_13830 [Rathayibacter rathayi]SOE04712.1 hypothetical protein SAMN06295924_10569 [Rathayibacter rathayi NCPPB 2980 = VKM Ac-1601]PPF14575.1 hypothetical protein C5C04_06360 [Rathayibacter rathayi]PPF49720.1 hypothetical protein C5C08_06620 [Rathayibacter rathayi]PPF79580.1 hypothetical protein C5C14_08155 [Rathayibacter rathayi]
MFISACAGPPIASPSTAGASPPPPLERADAVGRSYLSTSATESGNSVEWLLEKPLTFRVSDQNGKTVLVVSSPCNALTYKLDYRGANPLQWQTDGTPAQTYLGCFPEASAQEGWLRTLLEKPATRITQSIDEIVVSGDEVEIRGKESGSDDAPTSPDRP